MATIAQADDIYLNADELAKRWKMARSSIISWRSRHLGPPYIKIPGSNRVLYRLRDILQFEDACLLGLTQTVIEETIKGTPGVSRGDLEKVWAHWKRALNYSQ